MKQSTKVKLELNLFINAYKYIVHGHDVQIIFFQRLNSLNVNVITAHSTTCSKENVCDRFHYYTTNSQSQFIYEGEELEQLTTYREHSLD